MLRHLFSLLIMIGAVISCSANRLTPSVKTIVSKEIPDWQTVNLIQFSNDQRESDGYLKEMVFARNAQGVLAVYSHTRSSGQLGEPEDEKYGMHEDVQCENRFGGAERKGLAMSILCVSKASGKSNVRIEMKSRKGLWDISEFLLYSSASKGNREMEVEKINGATMQIVK